MPVLEHPMIEEINRNGFLGTIEEENTIEICKGCDGALKRGDTVVEFYDRLYCDEDCLTEAFCNNPSIFGMEKRELS